MTGKWEKLGATQHSKDCHGRFNWLNIQTFAKSPKMHERKIRESLEMNNLETKAEYDKSINVLIRDWSNIVNTNSWKPLFCEITMLRHANVIKQVLLRIGVNYIMYIISLCGTTKKSTS